MATAEQNMQFDILNQKTIGPVSLTWVPRIC